MLKRTKGRLLITLLVVTGLAGTPNTSTLSQKERKQAVTLMKETRNDFLKSIEGLTESQLDLRTSKNGPSIRELIHTIYRNERRTRREIDQLMQQPSNSEYRLKLAYEDKDIANCAEQFLNSNTSTAAAERDDIKETINRFIDLRNANIKYLRTSTEDLRNHVTESNIGWIDCYQKYLLLAEQTRRCTNEINLMKKNLAKN